MVETIDRAQDAELVWQIVEPPDFGLPAITTETWREATGSTWLGNDFNMALRVDYDGGVVSVAPKDGSQQILLEALASIALPLVAQHRGGLVLHGAAAARGGKAVMLSAEGGSGKSSLLMALVADGWEAVSEDQCVIDWDDTGAHRLWPGPKWVRLKQGVAPTRLVVGTSPRFEALDKVAWDLEPWMTRGPSQIEKIVLLDPPGGDKVVWEPIPTAEAVAQLSRHVTWVQSPQEFPRATLPQVVRLLMEVPAFKMRLPVRDDWLDFGVPLLAGE